MKTIGFIIFDGVERLDVEGPLGVLAWAGRVAVEHLEFRFLSKHGKSVRDHLVHKELPVDGATTGAEGFDLLIVPGGDLRQFGDDEELIAEVRRLGSASRTVASVCTGAFLIAQAGLADGRRITTHWHFRRQFRQRFPHITLSERRFEHDGTLWSSAGISAGIDMALRLVMSVWGDAASKQVQDSLEYYPEAPFSRP